MRDRVRGPSVGGGGWNAHGFGPRGSHRRDGPGRDRGGLPRCPPGAGPGWTGGLSTGPRCDHRWPRGGRRSLPRRLGGTIGCLSFPLTFLIAGILASQSLGLGWFWWLPFAIVILIPPGAIVGLSAELGVELHRRARSPRGVLATLGIVVPIVYVLAWMALYATQIARDRPLTDPPRRRRGTPPNQPLPFPDRMPAEPLPASDSTGTPHAGP